MAAVAAWLTIQLVNVMRWADARLGDPFEDRQEVDLQCFELWQAIHRHARQPTAAKPLMLIKDPAYDSLRHRFKKFFGVSPRVCSSAFGWIGQRSYYEPVTFRSKKSPRNLATPSRTRSPAHFTAFLE
jgi:hypothetical protein